MKEAHIMIKGFVQGVGYRKWARKEAQKAGITGWIRNLPDGSVEALLQGDKDTIEKLLNLYKKGPFLSEVEDIDTIWEAQKETFPDFSIRHDF